MSKAAGGRFSAFALQLFVLEKYFEKAVGVKFIVLSVAGEGGGEGVLI